MSLTEHNANEASRSSDQPIKRAPVVYGRRSSSHIHPSPVVPADEREEWSHNSDRVHHARAAPSRERGSSPSPSIHALGCERPCSPDAADHSFQFGFRHRLKELDEQFSSHDAQSSKHRPSPSSQAVSAGPSQAKCLQSVSMCTAILSSEARRSSDSRVSLSPPPTSFRAASAQDNPPKSPLVRRRPRTLSILSDSEAEEPGNSSSVSPARHAITTPHSRSSPTPPTSGEIPMTSRKTKGKALVRDVLPLLFDGEPFSVAEVPVKSKRGRRSESLVRSKTKAPTKKERREVAFESSRIAANRPVEIVRTQQQKHSLSAFFATLHRDNIVTPAPGTELPSDPIERFSSPIDNPTRAFPLRSVFGAPTGLLGTSVHTGTTKPSLPSEDAKALPPAAGDSDEEMPSVTSIIQQTSEKHQRLRVIKQLALQYAGANKSLDVNNRDDDLLIIEDDMHTVAREEAAQRRQDRAHGSPVKDLVSLRKIKHPSIRSAMVSPPKISKLELQELARPSFARTGKGAKSQLSKRQLDQLMITQHTQEQLRSIKRHEEEWVKRGGKLSRDTGGDGAQTSLSQSLGAYAEQGIKTAGTEDATRDEASADESDEDYAPDMQGSPGTKSKDVGEDDQERDKNLEISQVPQLPEEEDDDEVAAPSRRNKSGQRARVIVGSDDEGQRPAHNSLSIAQRDSASSMESQTEDENDKENSAKLMYDRSEDKENKAVVRHELSSSELASGSRSGFSHSVEDSVSSLSYASATASNNTTDSPKENVRSPLKDISRDEDDFFLSPPSSRPSFTECLLRSTVISPSRTSPSTLTLGSSPALRNECVGRINRFSLDTEMDENDLSGFKPLLPSFRERSHNQVSPEPSLVPINPLPSGGFSQLFFAEDQGSKKPIDRAENDELLLTLDVGLKPALEVNETLRQKAEAIFEKEEEYVVGAAVLRDDRPKELLYVNDHGFLTQTRPEGSSPQAYSMTPSQASKFIGTQIHSLQSEALSARFPLRTLSFTVSQQLSPEPQPLRRLRKRSRSPLEAKICRHNNSPVAEFNAFSLLGKASKPPSKAHKEEAKMSEFVAVEAEESDEDDMFGFGRPKMDDEEEEDDNEQNKDVEALVDDTSMDAETEAMDLVQEKYREHEAEDDQRLQKLHQDAVEGKFRIKRRDRGIGFEDDSDEDDDDDARRIRQRIHKKRKIEDDSLEALGQNEETRAFYNTYHQDLIDEDDEFKHLREDVAMPVGDDAPAEVPGVGETVSVDEIRQRVREMAQNNIRVEVLDPEDTSWIDQPMMVEADEAIRVKVVERRQGRSTARHQNAGQIDFDGEPKRHAESKQEREQMTSWAKNQGRAQRGTGRSGNSAAVTGHVTAKGGGGSLRSTQLANTAIANETRRTVRTSSLLSTVSNRKGKFT